MFTLSSKRYLSALLAAVSLSTMSSSVMANDCCCEPDCSRTYIGGFGGILYPESTRLVQQGTAYFTEAEGGPLAVLATGRAKKESPAFGGVQLGYEKFKALGCSNWNLGTGVELEAYWYNHNRKGHLFNDLHPERLPEHDFLDSFRVNSGVYLVNLVFSLNNCCFSSLTPYVGLGVGGTRLSIKKASSLQTSPPEEGINHFNSRRNDSSWAFAAQVKAGLRYNFCETFHVFGEYRYLYVDSSNYIFGSTVYPNHAATSPWNVKLENTQYNAWVVGLQYDL